MADTTSGGLCASLVAILFFRPWITVGLGSVLALFFFQSLLKIYQLRHIKGPFWNRFSHIPHMLDLYSEDFPKRYEQYTKKYGELVVIAPNLLVTSSQDMWVRMNTHPGYKKSKWFYRAVRFDWRDDNIFTQTDSAKHDARRKQMIRGYSGIENLTLAADIDNCLTKLIRLVRENYAKPNKPMDVAQKLHYFSLDVISTIGFGKCYNLMNLDADPDEFIHSINHGLASTHRQILWGTWWLNWIPFVGPKNNPDVETAKGFEKMMALNASMVEAREQAFREKKDAGGLMGREDMLASFMKHGLFGAELKTENLLQVVAGSDTTAALLRAMILYTITNPAVYKKLQDEIDEAVATGMAPRAPGTINFAQTKELPYLQAIIREATRVFSPVNNPLSRDVPPEGDTVVMNGEEVFIPGGTCIIPSLRGMHRNKRIYGDDVDVEMFRPERWIEEKDPQKLEAMKHDFDVSFGAGRWQCLGKVIALREAGVVMFELFRHFDWSIVNPEKPWKDKTVMGLHIMTDMWVRVSERKQVE